jgi:hypothetical protein
MKFAFLAALTPALAFAACGGKSDEDASTFRASDAGPSCTRADGAGDDTCHVVCTKDADCPANQDCVAIDFWGCTDFSGGSQNDHLKKICCPAGSSCQPP